MLNLQELKRSLTPNTFAVVFVHIGGSIPDSLLEIKKFCYEKKLILIEDAAHCIGSSLICVSAGSFGHFGCFSFFPTKTMTMGEGGFIICKSIIDEKYLRAYKNFGRTTAKEDFHEIRGYNMKVTELQAALGLVDLNRLHARLEKRRAIFNVYLNELKLKDAKILHVDRFNTSSCYKIIIRGPCDYLLKLEQKLNDKKIPLSGKVYSRPLNEQIYQGNDISSFKFPNAREFCQGHICPPLYPELEDKAIKYISKILNYS
jgi:dTDP-4-amino-4,6-dideoxygalactose transaminase